ncbi:MAG: sugar transferase [bacterium]|nr:sugar transferase [bacterium]
MENSSLNNPNVDIANDAVATTARTPFQYGIASEVASPVSTGGASVSMDYREYLNYFYCEYAKGLLFLALSLVFAFAVPAFLTKSGGLAVMVNRGIKRSVDILGAVTGLLLTLPIWLVLPIIIKLDSRGPVFYSQTRVGRNSRKSDRRFYQKTDVTDRRSRDRRRTDCLGKPFNLIKFRTMVDGAEKASGPVWATKNDPRITKLGRFMRKTRLDEIPQFINILKGDMSLVGPRPERPAFVADLVEKVDNYERRLEVKPGLTGLAQVSSGYDSSISSVAVKVGYDVEYIDNWSLWQDIKILLRTVVVVITGRGAC